MIHPLPWETLYSLEESKQIRIWNVAHDKICRILKEHKDEDSPYGVIAGGRTYSFTPTSIGTIMTVKCACGEEFIVDNNL